MAIKLNRKELQGFPTDCIFSFRKNSPLYVKFSCPSMSAFPQSLSCWSDIEFKGHSKSLLSSHFIKSDRCLSWTVFLSWRTGNFEFVEGESFYAKTSEKVILSRLPYQVLHTSLMLWLIYNLSSTVQCGVNV